MPLRAIIIAAFSFLLLIPASAQRDPDVDRAIKERYPQAATEITGRRDVNGVKVFAVNISTDEGKAIAEVTEFGDFLLYGVPRKDKQLPQAAATTLETLFQAKPEEIAQYRATAYLVDIDSGKKSYRLRFDAVGRLQDVRTVQSIESDRKNLESADDKGAKSAREYALKWNEGAEVGKVVYADESREFYLVDMKTKDGKDALLTVSSQGRVSSFQNQIETASIPEPVQQTMAKLFNTAKVKAAYRAESQYYEFEQNLEGDNMVSVQVRPDGEIMSITPRKISDKSEDSPVKSARVE